jgi:hypothetical protein
MLTIRDYVGIISECFIEDCRIKLHRMYAAVEEIAANTCAGCNLPVFMPHAGTVYSESILFLNAIYHSIRLLTLINW